MCGIPLNIPMSDNIFHNEHFLDQAICVSDVLSDLGYKQAYFSSADLKFAGTRGFLQTHKVEVRDFIYFQNQKLLPEIVPPNLLGLWGAKDAVIFGFARDYIKNEAKTPFALYISTIDTHISNTDDDFVDREYCPNVEQGYSGTIKCTDKIISDFVKFVQESDIGKNTTIVILGDHLSRLQGVFPPQTERFVFNTFINAKFTQKPSPHLIKNRFLSHFDMTPLILDSIGLKTEFFGLGRNPLYQKTLLESSFYTSEFNELLSKRNKMYDKFWEVKK